MHVNLPLAAIVSIHHSLILPVYHSISHPFLCQALPLSFPVFTISHTICHFKSILTFILHPSIQFLNILPPPIQKTVFIPPFSPSSVLSKLVLYLLHVNYNLTKYLKTNLRSQNWQSIQTCVTMCRWTQTLQSYNN